MYLSLYCTTPLAFSAGGSAFEPPRPPLGLG